MFGRASSSLHGYHSPVGGGLCSPVTGVEALRIGFNSALLPLMSHFVPKEVSAEASEVPVVTANLFTTCAEVHGSDQKQPKVTSLSPLCLS